MSSDFPACYPATRDIENRDPSVEILTFFLLTSVASLVQSQHQRCSNGCNERERLRTKKRAGSALKVSGAMEAPEVRNPRRFKMTIHVEEAQDQAGIPLPEDDLRMRRPRKPEALTQEEKLKAERVQERLRQEAPAWRLINSGTGISRVREFPDVRAA